MLFLRILILVHVILLRCKQFMIVVQLHITQKSLTLHPILLLT
jgi:hypothetical protein